MPAYKGHIVEMDAEVSATGSEGPREGRTERRIRRALAPRQEPDELLVAGAMVWVSVEGRLNRLVAARTRDHAVVTDRRLMLWSTGFFTRRPRRRVLVERLDALGVEDTGTRPDRRLCIRGATRKPLRFDVERNERGRRFALELRTRSAQAQKHQDEIAPGPEGREGEAQWSQ